MTVKELREKLAEFHDDAVVVVLSESGAMNKLDEVSVNELWEGGVLTQREIVLGG